MGEILTQSYSLRIINENSYNQKLISLIGILEGYLSKVSKKHFRSVKSSNLESLTLSELGIIQKSFFSENTGMNGVCWEYAVFYSIFYNDTYVQDLINMAINYLSRENTFERINAILWGGEKTTISLENIKSNIKDGETIWTPYGKYNFEEYVDIIYKSFASKKLKNDLPKHIDGIWKTDLFVKKESSDTWYAVTVKWNGNDVKYYNGLSIGIFYEYANSPILKVNPFPLANQNVNYFVNCAIPFVNNFGEYYAYIFRLFDNILSKINSEKKGTLALKFSSHEEFLIFEEFYDIKYAPCIQVINYLKGKYQYYISTFESNEIIEATDRQINFKNFNIIDYNEKDNGIKIIPL